MMSSLSAPPSYSSSPSLTPSNAENSLKIRDQIATISSKLLSRVSMATFRSFSEFSGTHPQNFCVSSFAFSSPVSHADKTAHEKIRDRLSLNLSYFATNYFFIAMIVAGIISLSHPLMLVYCGLVGLFWYGHCFILKNHKDLDLHPTNFVRVIFQILTPYRRSVVLLIVTCYVIVMYCLLPIFAVAAISSFVIFCHASFRDPKHIEQGFDRVDTEDDHDEGSSV